MYDKNNHILFYQSIISYEIPNCIVLKKNINNNKNDNVAVLFNAYIAYKAYREYF